MPVLEWHAMMKEKGKNKGEKVGGVSCKATV